MRNEELPGVAHFYFHAGKLDRQIAAGKQTVARHNQLNFCEGAMLMAQGSQPTIIPYFVYRDGAAALKWLTNVFGLEQIAAFTGPDGNILHAEMRFGNGAIMLGTATEEQRAQMPWDLPTGRGIYLYVEDVDAHYERARTAGAHIVYPPEDTGFGTRRYRALDLDGYEWSFGTYRPMLAP